MNKHREFMSHRLPVFTHAADPLDANDLLKTVGKMLTTAHCDDREKVLFAAGRLQGSAGAWWDAYTTAHATPNAITWQEFTKSFRNHHIPAGLMRLKKKEFLSLKQGRMSVAEYRDRFIELSRYAPEEVADDPKKQERFLEGLAGPLHYQLTSHTFPSFHHLLDKSIVLESMRWELGELKRKAATPGLSGRHTHPRFISPLGAGSPVPSRRPDRRLWPAAAVLVPATTVPTVSALSSAVSAPRAADSTPCIPATPFEDPRWYAREARCTSHPRGQHLL
jgi:hypothetical protein